MLRKLSRLLAIERYAADVVKRTAEPKELEGDQKDFLKRVRELGKSDDLPMIIEAERGMLEAELSVFGHCKATAARLKMALRELEVVEKHIGIVDDPTRYSEVDSLYRLPRSRRGGLPYDEARQVLRSHYARLKKMDEVRMSDFERKIFEVRKSNIVQAEKLYKQRQAKALGINEEQARTKSREAGK